MFIASNVEKIYEREWLSAQCKRRTWLVSIVSISRISDEDVVETNINAPILYPYKQSNRTLMRYAFVLYFSLLYCAVSFKGTFPWMSAGKNTIQRKVFRSPPLYSALAEDKPGACVSVKQKIGKLAIVYGNWI